MIRHLRLIFAILITLYSVAGLSLGEHAVAQDLPPKRFTSELTGSVVEIGNSPDANFDLQSHLIFESGTGYTQEDIYIDIPGGYFAVSFAAGDVNPQKWQTETIDNVASWYTDYADILGQEVGETESWLFTKGVNNASFSEFMYGEYRQEFGIGSTVDVYVFGIESTILDEIVWIQENVLIDGEPIFANADIGGIESMMNGTSSYQPKRIHRFNSEIGDWKDRGVTSATSWEPSLFDVSVTWDNQLLEFPLYFDQAIVTRPDSSQSILTLHTNQPEGIVRVNVFNKHDIPDGMNIFDFYQERYTGEEWLVGNGLNFPAISSVTAGEHLSVIYSGTDFYGQDGITIRTFWELPDGNMVAIDAFNHPQLLVATYEQVLASLQINGEPVEQMWSIDELVELFPPADAELDSSASQTSEEVSNEVTRTSRTSSNDSTSSESPVATGGDSVIAEFSGVTIDLGPTGEAVFVKENAFATQADNYMLESFTVDRGSTIIIIDVMEGDVDMDRYMAAAEGEIATTYNHTEWLGGEWSAEHSWDIYSGAYKLDYREIVYLEMIQDPDSGLYFAIGVYGSAEDVQSDIPWLQTNITIDGKGILSNADLPGIQSVIEGTSDFAAETVPVEETEPADWSSEGLVSETEWQSPFNNSAVSWDGEHIVFPSTHPTAINNSDDYSVLRLGTPDRRGDIKLSIGEADYSLSDWVETYTSDEFVESQTAQGFPVQIVDSLVTDETGSVIFIQYTALGHPVVVIMDVFVNADGVTIVSQIEASPADIAEIYGIFYDSVQLNGEFYPLTWSVEDIADLTFE